MNREAAREMRSLPEYRGDYVFVEYLIHLMIQEESDDNMILSIPNMAGRIKAIAKNLPQRTLVMNYPMPLPGLKMPLTTWMVSCNDCCAAIMPLGVQEGKCLSGCGGTYTNRCRGMHCQGFTMKEAIFKAGVILIACKVWAKREVVVCLFNMGGVGSELFFNQVDDQLCYFWDQWQRRDLQVYNLCLEVYSHLKCWSGASLKMGRRLTLSNVRLFEGPCASRRWKMKSWDILFSVQPNLVKSQWFLAISGYIIHWPRAAKHPLSTTSSKHFLLKNGLWLRRKYTWNMAKGVTKAWLVASLTRWNWILGMLNLLYERTYGKPTIG